MALKVRQSPEYQGIKLPQSKEDKISQFADDTTLICSDITGCFKSSFRCFIRSSFTNY